jgi:hypothetical protein
MERKELVLSVAKDLMIAYKLNPPEKDRADREKMIKSMGALLSQVVKEVERVYDEIRA